MPAKAGIYARNAVFIAVPDTAVSTHSSIHHAQAPSHSPVAE
jgi:hypothetical protein